MSSPHKPTPADKIELPENPLREWSEEDVELEDGKPNPKETEEDEIDL